MKKENLASYILGGSIVLGFFALLYVLIFVTIPPENKDILNTVIGSLIASFSAVVGYYFGSTAGSRAKDELLANSTPIQPTILN